MSARVDPLLPGLGRWPLAASVAKGLVGAAVALALVVALSGCRAVAPDADLPPPPTDAAEGAAAPPGLADIRKGMSQREVLRILRPYHEVLHAADASPEAPLVDYFVYVEDGAVKYGEVFYERDRVLDVRYGYAEPFFFID